MLFLMKWLLVAFLFFRIMRIHHIAFYKSEPLFVTHAWNMRFDKEREEMPHDKRYSMYCLLWAILISLFYDGECSSVIINLSSIKNIHTV